MTIFLDAFIFIGKYYSSLPLHNIIYLWWRKPAVLTAYQPQKEHSFILQDSPSYINSIIPTFNNLSPSHATHSFSPMNSSFYWILAILSITNISLVSCSRIHLFPYCVTHASLIYSFLPHSVTNLSNSFTLNPLVSFIPHLRARFPIFMCCLLANSSGKFDFAMYIITF